MFRHGRGISDSSTPSKNIRTITSDSITTRDKRNYAVKNSACIYQPLPMNRFISRLLDFVYPAGCQVCQLPLTHGRHLCKHCIDQLKLIEPPYCAQCGECYDGQLAGHFVCPNCNALDVSYEFARAALHSEGHARDLIHEFKYLRKIYLADELARLIEFAFEDSRFLPYQENGILVPVPLFWRRQRKRQFNQSEQIAKHLSSRTGISYQPALTRIRNTETQTHFNRAKRLKNLKHAFSINPRHLAHIQDKPIILIDDVFTTGSTADECSRVLLEHGASRVAVLTVLRG
jgi:competence protein ComFC